MANIPLSLPLQRGNRVNSSGLAPLSTINKSSAQISQQVPAGGTLTISIPGTRFYVIATSGPLAIKPSTQNEQVYYQGMGLKCAPENAFDLIAIRNPSATNIVYFILFVGFDELDDRRLVYPSNQFEQIGLNTYSTYDGDAAVSVALPDLSGTIISDDADAAGYPLDYYAINRQGVYIANHSNSNAGQTILVKAADTGRTQFEIFYAQTLVIPVTKTPLVVYSSDGLNMACLVTEIYNCLPLVQ